MGKVEVTLAGDPPGQDRPRITQEAETHIEFADHLTIAAQHAAVGVKGALEGEVKVGFHAVQDAGIDGHIHLCLDARHRRQTGTGPTQSGDLGGSDGAKGDPLRFQEKQVAAGGEIALQHRFGRQPGLDPRERQIRQRNREGGMGGEDDFSVRLAHRHHRIGRLNTHQFLIRCSHGQSQLFDAVDVFHNRDGRAIERFVEKIISFRQAGASGDIAIGLLNRPLPASIRTYAVPEPRSDYASTLPGTTALVTDQSRSLFFHQISSVQGSTLQFRFDPATAPGHRKNLIIGDSGNPSFLLSHGELVLIETHSTGGPGSGPFYGAPDVVAALRKIIATLDPTYSLRTVAIDARTLAEASAARTALQSASGGAP